MADNFSFWLLLVSAALLGNCQPQQKPPASTTPKLLTAGNLKRLVGTWVRQDTSGPYKGGFQLVRINADSTGTFTSFKDDTKALGRAFFRQHPDFPHYFFMDGPLKVHYQPQRDSAQRKFSEGNVQIWTSRFRFDYYLLGDTLLEHDKMGYQGKLVRVHPAR
ncbi:MAG: hypothetical protein EOO57_05080 [Hymenobacter sp.]|nr:MAG: hypothetical protein EOO57_05080 [Hymenobacter sp.]